MTEYIISRMADNKLLQLVTLCDEGPSQSTVRKQANEHKRNLSTVMCNFVCFVLLLTTPQVTTFITVACVRRTTMIVTVVAKNLIDKFMIEMWHIKFLETSHGLVEIARIYVFLQ